MRADELGAAVVGQEVMSCPASVIEPVSGVNAPAMALNSVDFARAVGADDGCEIAVRKMQVDRGQRFFLIDGAGVEDLADVFSSSISAAPFRLAAARRRAKAAFARMAGMAMASRQ